MSDPTGVPAALGIEAVECLQEGGNVVVRVTGRWRRRRPEWRGPALLMIEAEDMRHRFPAMPEPPSLSGTLPGTWRMSFSVAAELAPHLIGRAWLQLDTLVVPLPELAEAKLRAVAEEARAYRMARAGAPEARAARDLRSAEAAADGARRRAAHAEADAAALLARVTELERALEQARLQPNRLELLLARSERRRTVAEQRAHAESALRREAEERLAELTRAYEAARARAGELADRLAQAERAQLRLRRAVDEAEHAAAGARSVQARAERALAELSLTPADSADSADSAEERRKAARIELESRLAGRLLRGPTPASRPPRRVPSRGSPVLGAELEMVRRRAAATAAAISQPDGPYAATLARERAALEAAERRTAALERVLSEERRRWASAAEGIEEVRRELAELRAERELVPAGVAVVEEADASGQVQAERLREALERLRESRPPSDGAHPGPTAPGAVAVLPGQPPAPPGLSEGRVVRPWLVPVFRSLTKADPIAAGRLVLALLPAQRAVSPLPVAYDLVIDDVLCVRVTVGPGAPEIEYAHRPRPEREVQFRVDGELGHLARLLVAGRVKRRLGRGVARIHGDRSAAAALRLLVHSPLTLRRLHALGVRLDAGLALAVCARMLDPGWTTGERFTIAHQPPGAPAPAYYLRVSDGASAAILERAPADDAAATIVCPGEALLPALAGARGEGVFVRGDQRPLGLLAGWLERTQGA